MIPSARTYTRRPALGLAFPFLYTFHVGDAVNRTDLGHLFAALPSYRLFSSSAAISAGRGPSRVWDGRGLKILFVEDNPDTLRSLTRQLRSDGLRVEPAASVGAALDAASRVRLDLVLCDIGLPDGSGPDVIRHVRDRWGLRGIAFSGYGADEDIRASREAGFEHHPIKPVDFAALLGVIRGMAT